MSAAAKMRHPRRAPLAPARAWLALTLGLALAAGGCDEWEVTTETRIDAAGRLERRTTIAYTGSKAPDGCPPVASVFRLPQSAAVAEQGRARVVIVQRADAPGDLEPDVRLEGQAGRPDPHNHVRWSVADCVFFEHYVYAEEVRDNVDFAERVRATQALFAMLRELALELAELAGGGRYGTGRLERWLDGEGRALVFDLVRIGIEVKDAEELERRLGLRVLAEGVESDDGAVSEEAVTRFVAHRLAELLDPPEGGAPLDAGALLAQGPEGEPRVLGLLEQALVGLYGSADAADEAFAEAIGAIGGDLSGTDIRFEARVTLPGRLLRTTGWVDPDGRAAEALFRFDTDDAAHTGYTVEMESVVLRPERWQSLPRPKAELGASDILAVVAALGDVDAEGRARLGRALAEAAEHGLEEATERLRPELQPVFRRLVEAASRPE